jgi:hypothetical protein
VATETINVANSIYQFARDHKAEIKLGISLLPPGRATTIVATVLTGLVDEFLPDETEDANDAMNTAGVPTPPMPGMRINLIGSQRQPQASSNKSTTPSRQKGDRMKETTDIDGALDQLDGITRKQSRARQQGVGDATVRSTKKSQDNVDKRLKEIKSSKDSRPDDDEIE